MNFRQFLIEQVDTDDLRAISYELGIHFDRLRAETKEGTVDNFLGKVNQYGRSEALANLLKRHYTENQPPVRRPPAAPEKKITLLQFLNQYFNVDDLQELAFELNIEFENLAGTTKRAKARALAARMVQMKRIPELVQAVRQARPFMEPGQIIMPADNLAERVLWEDRRIIALTAVIVVMLAATAGYFIWLALNGGETWATNEPVPEDVFGIAVAEFAVGGDLHSGPRGQEISRQIYAELEKALDLQPSLRNKVALTRVGLVRNDEEATQTGTAVNVDIVLWGWVPEFTETALVHNFTFIGDQYVVHNDLILESVNLMISGPSRIQMTQLSGRTKALSRFILALIYVRGDGPGDYQQGLNLFTEGIRELENDRVRLTELIDKATNLDERLGLEETLASLQKSLAVFHTGKGVAHAALGQPDEALASYQTAVALDDSYPRVYAVLGNYYYSLRQFDQAEAAYKKAIELEPETASAWYGLGVVYYYEEAYEQALRHLEQAIVLLEEVDEDAGLVYFAKGYTYLQLAQTVQARNAFEMVLQSEEAPADMKETVTRQIAQIDNPKPVAVATAVPQPPPAPTNELAPTPIPTGATAVEAPTVAVAHESILGATIVPSPTMLPTLVALPTMTPPPTLLPTIAATATTDTTIPLLPTFSASPPPATETPVMFPTFPATPTAEVISPLFPTFPATATPPE